ncbi:hypothetical protein [Ferrimonas lipolytica]|uniref:Anti-sigma-K factor rskA n=1 Tax=Ferrimonas lipolytica TaxID=2724191 RepID=A0A6H1UEL1_9GAMM|nr:hypothetical protein [Ferrimonas lipolytica]QIZ77521.1 hypothetical protein HER31_11850 [Ferrimonas lipolytica]
MKQDKLEQLLAQTPAELTPNNDLWPIITAKINTKQRQPFNQWAVAASLVIGVLIGGIGGYQIKPQPRYDPQLLQGVLQVLSEQHQQQLAQLPPSNPLVAAADLQALRSGASELQQALLQQPNNQALLELWLWTKQRELELLQTRLSHPEML